MIKRVPIGRFACLCSLSLLLAIVLFDQSSSGAAPRTLPGSTSVRVTPFVTGDATHTSRAAARLAAAPGQRSNAPSAAAAKLVRAGDLLYQGAFKLPRGTIGGSSFDYGGTALAFNQAHGSLFMVGHDWQQQVAEVAVPALRPGAGFSDLAIARVLQPFADATDGRLKSVAGGQNDTVKVGGLLIYRGQLYLTAYVYYDAAGSQVLSHFVSGLDLSVKDDVLGPFQVGKLGAGLVSGYFGLVPADWQDALGGPVLNGQCCLSIISRTSYGPAVFAIDPTKLGPKALPAVPLVYYPASHPLGPWGGDSVLFNGTTNVGGVVFPEGTSSVLFFGRQGLGPWCYGEGSDCGDPSDSAKGGHGFPYASYVWGYDAADLALVKNGKRQPWDVKPYAVWKLDLPFAVPSASILGVAYDPQTGRIFVSQAHGDGDNPLIHVFTLRS